MHTVFTVHDLSLIRFPNHHPKERVLFNNIFWSSRCKKTDHFLAVSEFTKSELINKLNLPEKKISVTPLAHENSIFFPQKTNEINNFLSKQGLPKQYFLFVGTGDTRKNMNIIPKALELAEISIPLVVAGWTGWSKANLSELVIPAGYVSDPELALLYSGATALVFPSQYEGFGLPVLEAMACGCPTVISNRASLPEIAGKAAITLYDPDDPLQLGKILWKLIQNQKQRKQMKQEGLKRAALFNWRHTATLTYQAFASFFSLGLFLSFPFSRIIS